MGPTWLNEYWILKMRGYKYKIEFVFRWNEAEYDSMHNLA